MSMMCGEDLGKWVNLKTPVHLLILVDQAGSMTPFHDCSQNLVETAKNESSIERVDVAYFHNLPSEYVYQDSCLTDKISWETVLNRCDSETRVLIVSEGGADGGYCRRRARVSATVKVIWEIKLHSELVVWLNPIPQKRWNGTALIISHVVPMLPMDKEGVNKLVLFQIISTSQLVNYLRVE